MQEFHFIGDIHGHAGSLKKLLKNLGYKLQRGRFVHPAAHAVFVGDLINRGPEAAEVVGIAKAMSVAGNATVLLGNHEFQNMRKLVLTGKAFPGFSKSASTSLCEWLISCPLWFSGSGVRAIHACWDFRSIAELGIPRLRHSDLFTPISDARASALRRILNGPTLRGPSPCANRFRVRWWVSSPPAWDSFAFSSSNSWPDTSLPAARCTMVDGYPGTEPPVFFGHYGFAKPAAPLAGNVACLDLGIATGGPVCAYVWRGEKRLSAGGFRVIR
jgi:hypothetical protein